MKSRLVTKKEGGRDLSRPRGPLELCIAVKTSGTEFKFHKLVRPLHPRCNQVGWSRPTKLEVSLFHLLCLIPQHPLCLREKPRPHEVDAVPGKRGCLFQADRIRIWALTNHNADALEIPYGDPLLLFFFLLARVLLFRISALSKRNFEWRSIAKRYFLSIFDKTLLEFLVPRSIFNGNLCSIKSWLEVDFIDFR